MIKAMLLSLSALSRESSYNMNLQKCFCLAVQGSASPQRKIKNPKPAPNLNCLTLGLTDPSKLFLLNSSTDIVALKYREREAAFVIRSCSAGCVSYKHNKHQLGSGVAHPTVSLKKKFERRNLKINQETTKEMN